MKALFLSAPQSFEYRETSPPRVPEGWVRVRMRYVGICGSDIHYYADGRIGDQVVQYPFVLGHEGSGEVSDGAGRFPKRAPIYIEPAISCHQCDQCLAGRENTCRNLKFLGNPRETPGCMCEEIALPPECIFPLPDWMGLDEAVLLEPLSIGVYAVQRSRAETGCCAAIVGAGPMGLVVQLALSDLTPRRILASEPVAARRAAAEKLGAQATFDPGAGGASGSITEASQGGVDVAFECAGTQESIDDAARMLKPGGTLVLIGIPEGLDRVTYDPHHARRREITTVNIRRQTRCVERALSILEKKRDATRVLLTHRFEPVRAGEAFDLVHRKDDGVVKALLSF
jgi:L-iditol 2-dehydrogenase